MKQPLTATIPLDESFAKDLRIAIVRTEYHQQFNDTLEKHARNTLLQNGIVEDHIRTFVVPGSWELPLMVHKLADVEEFDAIIVFGVIIKGETYHFDMIANEVARSLMQLSLSYSIPIALEVLAVYNLKQAEERAGDDEYNKGIEGATAVLKQLQALHTV